MRTYRIIRRLFIVNILFLLSACAVETQSDAKATTTSTLVPEPTSTSIPIVSSQGGDIPLPWRKLIFIETNVMTDILGNTWLSYDRGIEEEFAWITLVNQESNGQLTQVFAYLEPGKDRTSLFGDYGLGTRELDVESELSSKYDDLKLLGLNHEGKVFIFIEVQIETELYGAQWAADNPEKESLENIYYRDVKEVAEYLIKDSINKAQVVPTPVAANSQVFFTKTESFLISPDEREWLHLYDNVESIHICRYFENAIPYGVKWHSLMNCVYDSSQYGWHNVEDMATSFMYEGDEIITSAYADDSRFFFGYMDGGAHVVAFYYDEPYSFGIILVFAQPADKPSDLFDNATDDYMNTLILENIENWTNKP